MQENRKADLVLVSIKIGPRACKYRAILFLQFRLSCLAHDWNRVCYSSVHVMYIAAWLRWPGFELHVSEMVNRRWWWLHSRTEWACWQHSICQRMVLYWTPICRERGCARLAPHTVFTAFHFNGCHSISLFLYQSLLKTHRFIWSD